MESLALVTLVNTVVIPICLFLIMMGMGLTLITNDFKRVLKYPKAVGIGLTNQLILLPIIGFALANIMPLRPEYAQNTPSELCSLCCVRVALPQTYLPI